MVRCLQIITSVFRGKSCKSAVRYCPKFYLTNLKNTREVLTLRKDVSSKSQRVRPDARQAMSLFQLDGRNVFFFRVKATQVNEVFFSDKQVYIICVIFVA
jgi:hypothetical protein